MYRVFIIAFSSYFMILQCCACFDSLFLLLLFLLVYFKLDYLITMRVHSSTMQMTL